MSRYLALIPARGGSKGVPGKNIRLIAGRPLVAWTIEQARQSSAIDRVVVSTDSPEISDVARNWGADVPFMRPASLATDQASTESAMIHAVEELATAGYKPDAIVLLQATSPIRRPGTIDRAIAEFERQSADSILSVCQNNHFFWRYPHAPEALYDYHRRPRRQDIAPQDRWWRETGSLYVTKTDLLLATKNRLGGKIGLFEMEEDESYEIDSLTDFQVLEALIQRVLGSGPGLPSPSPQ
ncbi:MAG: acylneuraminate cytidylyltransferase family protein [Alphaproteobacteria bacterium]|nr:acylneuraminate cytidylyltransferase family protein [Alphaproteobacteria bacterium]